MNQKQKDKFHKAIKDLNELMNELNSGVKSYDLIYNSNDCRFHISILEDLGYTIIEKDDTYFPMFEVQE